MKSGPLNPAVIIIFPKDLKRLLPHLTSKNGIYLHYRKIKECIGKQKHQRITLKEFADWEGLPIEDVLKEYAQ